MRSNKENAMALVEYFNARRTSLIIEVNKVKRSKNRDLLMPLKTTDRLNLINEIRTAIILLIDANFRPTGIDMFLDMLLHSYIKTITLKEPVNIRTKKGVFKVISVCFDEEGFVMMNTELAEPNDIIPATNGMGVKEFIKLYKAVAESIED